MLNKKFRALNNALSPTRETGVVNYIADDSLFRNNSRFGPQNVVYGMCYDSSTNTINIAGGYGRFIGKVVGSASWDYNISTTTPTSSARYLSPRFLRKGNILLWTLSEGQLYSDSFRGISTTVDGGRTWSLYNFAVTNTTKPEYSAPVTLANGTIIVGVSNNTANATDSGYLYTSTDAVTWTPITSLRSLANTYWNKGVISAVYTHVSDSNTFIVAGKKPVDGSTDTDTESIYITKDNGTTWTDITSVLSGAQISGITMVFSTTSGFIFCDSGGDIALYNSNTNTASFVYNTASAVAFGSSAWAVLYITGLYENSISKFALYGLRGQIVVYDVSTGTVTSDVALYSLTGAATNFGDQYTIVAGNPSYTSSYALCIARGDGINPGAYEYVNGTWNNISSEVFNINTTMTTGVSNNSDPISFTSQDERTILLFDPARKKYAYSSISPESGDYSFADKWSVVSNYQFPALSGVSLRSASIGADIVVCTTTIPNTLFKFSNNIMTYLTPTLPGGVLGADSQYYYHITTAGQIRRSSDATTWTLINSTSIINSTMMKFVNNSLFCIGGRNTLNLPNFYTSTDGWATVIDISSTLPSNILTSTSQINSIIYIDGYYFVCLNDNTSTYVLKSADLSSWTYTVISSSGFNTINDVLLYANKTFFICASTLSKYSLDGVTWNSITALKQVPSAAIMDSPNSSVYDGAGGPLSNRFLTINNRLIYVRSSPLGRSMIYFIY